MPEGICAIGSPAVAQQRVSSSWTLWGQWVAIGAMMADHLVVYLFPDGPFTPWVSGTIGRVAFPVFAGMMAWHALYHTRSLGRYLARVLVIGVVAQVFYMGFAGYPVYAYFNVCFTLALGLTLYRWARSLQGRVADGRAGTARGLLEGLVVLPLVLVASLFVEFGPAGVMLLPAFLLAFRFSREGSWEGPVAAAGLLVVATIMNSGALASAVGVVVTASLLILPNAMRGYPPIRMPRWLWLAWYPGHFALLLLAQSAMH